MAAEWAYSLHDALNYFEKEVHIKVFLDIINGVGEFCFLFSKLHINREAKKIWCTNGARGHMCPTAP